MLNYKIEKLNDMRLFFQNREDAYKIINFLNKASNRDIFDKNYNVDLRSYDYKDIISYEYNQICILEYDSRNHIIIFKHDKFSKYYEEIKKAIIPKFCEKFGILETMIEFDISENDIKFLQGNIK